ncbi:MAG: hypothetical protein H0V01_05805 [Bacteroidetes bacterium]|nr:hypothetical protein [Bacteroidota bacterium]HET6244336.1 DUF6428 family protein [Bacteroidia bacterium]
MKLSQFKKHLATISAVNFVQPNGTFVPRHFHVTEAGLTTKHFIDCGGTVRTEKTINFQVWVAQDFNHRLEPNKLQKIISLSENLFGNEDLEVEVEYQTETIGRYGLDTNGENFMLTAKATDCLAKDNCGVPEAKHKLELSELPTEKSCCSPGGGCC